MILSLRLSLLSITFGLMAAQSAPAGGLLVLSKGDHTLAIVDVASGKVTAKMPSGPDPHEVVASADGKLAYISNYGGGAYNTLTVVDLIAHKTLPVIDLGALRGPHGLAVAGNKIWFTAEAAKAIGSFDPATQKIDWILGTGQDRTHMVYVTADLKQIFTTNVSSATVSLIEKRAISAPGPGGPPRPGAGNPPPGGPRLDWEETVVAVGKGAEGFDVSPDRKELWAANAWDGTVSVVDIASAQAVDTLAADVRGANRLKFTPDGKYVLISSLSGSDLTVIDAGTRKVAKRIKMGHGAAGIQMEPGGERAYVACTPDNYVAVIDLHSMEVTGHIDAGSQPDGLAWEMLQ